MKLRAWQSECITAALQHFQYSSHFLCQATPGAGKSRMAAELAQCMLAEKKVDFVICFSPSINVTEGMRQALSKSTGRRFDGVIGAAGGSYTYQRLLSLKEDFWQLFDEQRVLVIFDEIHHCSGLTEDDCNAWGQEILLNIRERATYTLALTGTPWRSDQAPIVLAQYVDPDNQIQCHYHYGLSDAVKDNVCRRPKIVLIENENIHLFSSDKETRTFNSLLELLSTGAIPYASVITNAKIMHYMLQAACQRLDLLRQESSNAAGLVVASSVEHAQQIVHMLHQEFGRPSTIVTYKHDEPASRIDRFRHSKEEWIVSVGMISEGTDIPRLQICCHLSHIKTELHYRQLLGRILRLTNTPNQEAWLYTLAEPKLVEFAHRIADDLPEHNVIIRESSARQAEHASGESSPNAKATVGYHSGDIEFGELIFDEAESHEQQDQRHKNLIENKVQLSMLGQFRETVIATFDSPFENR